MKPLALTLVGFTAGIGSCLAFPADSDKSISIDMHAVSNDGVGKRMGQITVKQVDGGLAFQPQISGIEQGLHGFHIHEAPDCGVAEKDGEITAAGAAGSHFDPRQHQMHAAPWEEGHRGDLPALYVDENKRANHAVFKADLTLEDVKGRALVIHEGGDNYADAPKSSGGGGARVACGVIPK